LNALAIFFARAIFRYRDDLSPPVSRKKDVAPSRMKCVKP
jgi:hypothetical protein